MALLTPKPALTTPASVPFASQATTPGGSTVSTVSAVNQISGEKELEFTFENTTGAAIANIPLFQACWNVGSDGTRNALPNGITYSAPNFTTYAMLQAYYGTISTNIYGMTLQTTDVSNYLGSLIVSEMDASGKTYSVTKRLSKYRIPVGNGYSDTLRLGVQDWNNIKWPAASLVLSSLAANSSITFLLAIRGWNKAQDLSDMQPDIIG